MSVDFTIAPTSGTTGPMTMNIGMGWTSLGSGSNLLGYVHISGDIVSVGIVSGGRSAQVSGIVGVSGQVSILSGFLAILSGSIGAQVSGAVIVSGSVSINSGLVGILSGSLSALVSGSVIISGNVGILSGSAIVGSVEGRPSNSGGLAVFRAQSGLTNTGSGINVISGSHQLFLFGWANYVGSGMWAKLYDSTAVPTIGTTVPILSFALTPSGGPTFVNLAAGQVGTQINNGLWINLVGKPLDNDTTNVSGQSGQAMIWSFIRSGT